MRGRQRAVVFALLLSMVSTAGFGYLAVSTQSAADEAQQASAAHGVPLPGSSSDPSSNTFAVPEAGPTSTQVFLSWAATAICGFVFLVSFVLFRVQVGAEKVKMRLQESRAEYYRQLKQYTRQLKGPPQKNN